MSKSHKIIAVMNPPISHPSHPIVGVAGRPSSLYGNTYIMFIYQGAWVLDHREQSLSGQAMANGIYKA